MMRQWLSVISHPHESGDCGTSDNLADCEAKLGRALARILARVTKGRWSAAGVRALSAGHLSG